ncbi:T9SS type A sorting domain-containing protein [Chitinophaga sp. Cy-1792]|uniref:T9SS type A sorting domain-containing protein n=1 Tax=Chitinophaga sp. Cy-1792 TaxID=2608339 RepID=UPI001422F6EB|nr:T9SS type A sorting domain-containing protein [Chitinophaga sp. Cy-1792]NIG55054.1 T9SS type A sorting domain-containing protein [Chitinophaga sp. Cy-1792]
MKRILLFLFFIIPFITEAQVADLQFKVTALGANYNDSRSKGARFRFYQSQWTDDYHRLICIQRTEQNFNAVLNGNDAVIFNWWTVNLNSVAKLIMVTHNERKDDSDPCTAQGVSDVTTNVPDLHEASTTIQFTPSTYPQGQFIPLGRTFIYSDGYTTYADVSIKLPVLKPGTPQLNDNYGSTTNFCTNDSIRLSSVNSFNSTGLTYTWEYAITDEDYNIKNPDKCFCESIDPSTGKCGHWGDVWYMGADGNEYSVWQFIESYDCDLPDYVTVHNWKVLKAGTTSNSFYFDPKTLVPGNTTTKKVLLRVKATSPLNYVSEYSDISTFFFLPSPPKVDASRKIETKACYGEENGSVVIPHTAIVSNYTTLRWLLRKGTNPQPCDPTSTGNTSCGDVLWSNGAEPANKDIVINGMAPGDYSLWILNPGNEAGNCYTPVVVHIGQEDQLQIPADKVITANVSCNGANDGRISVTAIGGKVDAGYKFTLKDQGNNILVPEQLVAGNTFSWNNLAAGNYTAVVQNGACSQSVSVKVTLTQPPLITGQIDVVQPDCNTPGNGSISITATPVATNYQYRLWQNGTLVASSAVTTATSYIFPDLHSGDYSVEIINADFPACTGWSTTATLNAVPALAIQLTQRDSVSCYGGSDGHLAFSASGGSGQFRYELTDANNNVINNNTGDFTDLAAGNYTAKVYNRKLSCNDFAAVDVEVFQRAPLTVSLVPANISCNGAADGTLRAVAGGGSASWKYTWQQLKNGNWIGNSFWFSTDVKIEGLEAGTYRVIVTDLKSPASCTVTSDPVTITEPTPIVLGAIHVTDAICMADGAQLSASASGGDGTYTFAWSANNGTTYTAFTSPMAVRQPGDYIIKVTDASGCVSISDNPAHIALPAAPLSMSATMSDYHGFNISCKDAADGIITVTAAGGNGGAYSGYQYKIDNGAFQAGNIFDHLTQGTYVITVRDGRGCEVSSSYTLTQPDLQLTVTKQDINCYGAATGTLSAAISGGAAPYQLTLNGNPVAAGQPMTGLAAGQYSLHATDANGCSQDVAIRILYTYPQLSINTATATDIRCLGETGLITLSGNGGDNNYTFYISNNNWATATTYTSGSPLAAGTYQLRVADGAGCNTDYSSSLTITAPAAAIDFTTVLSDYNGFNISCVGGNNGYAQITATGGNGNEYTGYTYAIDNGPFGANSLVQDIYAGTHLLKVQDGRGCIVSKPVTLTESAKALSIALVSKQDVRCAATPGGSITVTGAGGAGQLQYSIDGTTWQAGTTFNGLVAGDYRIKVKDLNSCSNVLDVTIASLNPAITIDNITSKDIVCYGTSGTIALQSHGGSGVLTNQYSLNGNAYTNFTNTTALPAGSYVVRVTDAIGCNSKESMPITISSPAAALSATITTSDFNGRQISCYGLQDGTFSIVAAGGNGATYTGYTYSINGAAYTNTPNYTNQPAGNYTIAIKDSRGCVINKSVSLTQPSAPVSLAVINQVNLDCGGVPTGKFDLQANGGTSPYTYAVTGNNNSTGKYDQLDAGIYNAQVKDVNGCTATATTTIKALYPAIAATAAITPVNCFGETSGAIRISATGGDGTYNYQWSNGNGNSQVADRIPAGNYDLRITDGKGCYKDFNYTVVQPELLNMSATGAAVCDGLNDGAISATVTGGTSPYNYSLNNGAFTTDASFKNIVPGSYNLLVKDAHGCMTHQDLTIEKANVKPDVDFLVASRKNAMDTLIIKEISLPAPDHVTWNFHPLAMVLGYSEGTPIVKFNAAGTYWIEMEATFGSCTYTLRKNITIDNFDPTAGPSYNTPVQVIDTAMLSPNPNTGVFKLNVKLNRKQQAIVTVFDMTGKIYDKRQYTPTMTIDDQFSLSNVITGTYVLRIVTENESKDIRFIITR